MEKTINELTKLLEKPLSVMEVVVDEIYFYEKSKNKFLTVVVDKVGGIDLDTIVEVSKKVSSIIDSIEVPVDNYVLDVISKERG